MYAIRSYYVKDMVLARRIERALDWCRRWILVDLGCSILLGMIEDDLLAPGGMAATGVIATEQARAARAAPSAIRTASTS